jgi:hypothetical protein
MQQKQQTGYEHETEHWLWFKTFRSRSMFTILTADVKGGHYEFYGLLEKYLSDRG